jgi:transcriptional regulator NrdR family protein
MANTAPVDKFLCPACGHAQSFVKSTRFNAMRDAVVRLRVCRCGLRYETEEKIRRVVKRKMGRTVVQNCLHIVVPPS